MNSRSVANPFPRRMTPDFSPSAAFIRARLLGDVLVAEVFAADHGLSALTDADLVKVAREAAHVGRLALFECGRRYCERCGDLLSLSGRRQHLCQLCYFTDLAARDMARDPNFPDGPIGVIA